MTTEEMKIEKEDLQDILGETLIEEYEIKLWHHHMRIGIKYTLMIYYRDILGIYDTGNYVEIRFRTCGKTYGMQICRTSISVGFYEVK